MDLWRLCGDLDLESSDMTPYSYGLMEALDTFMCLWLVKCYYYVHTAVACSCGMAYSGGIHRTIELYRALEQ